MSRAGHRNSGEQRSGRRRIRNDRGDELAVHLGYQCKLVALSRKKKHGQELAMNDEIISC